MKIGIFTSVFFNNIGNGFIDIGTEATLRAALPKGGEIIKLSQCANFAASLGRIFLIKENPCVNWMWTRVMQKYAKRLHDKSYRLIPPMSPLGVAKYAKLDYFILPGCILTVPFFTLYGKLLDEKTKAGTKLIFLGASGNFYNTYEIKIVSEWLQRLHPYAIMTRDSQAYKHYAEYSTFSYNGIDNAFFVNLSNLPKIETNIDPYVVLNFDEPKHKKIKEQLLATINKNVIYTDHKPFPYSKISKLVKQGVIISDTPLDYLFIYSNTTETYSDRVHACIPTLSFGHKARLFSSSPRIALFDNVGLSNITQELVVIKNLRAYQDKQIKFLASILK